MAWRIAALVLLVRLVSGAQPEITPAPHGPFHVNGRAIVDSSGASFLIRGTQLPGLGSPSTGFGLHSSTTLITIRQRWNMNAVRIPVSLEEYERDPSYLSRLGEVVRRANSLELLVIVAATEPDATRFWLRAAGYFKDYPNVFFAASALAVPVIRETGATQPIVVATPDPVRDRNIIYEQTPRWNDIDINDKNGTPVLARLPDLHLENNSDECASSLRDPADAEGLIQTTLTSFDRHGVSWIASSFEPGQLIVDYRHLDATTLDNGLACGAPADERAGMGVAVQFYLWGAEDLRGLLVVNAATGGIVVSRGGMAIGYGPIFGTHEERVPDQQFRAELAGVSARITDSRGASHEVRISYVSDGWGQINLLIPDGCALGPAQVTVMGRGGRRTTANVIVADTAPGVFSGSADGRGAAMGFLEPSDVPIFRCRAAYEHCEALPIPLPATVRFRATGLRHAGPLQGLRVTVGGVSVRDASIRAGSDPGVDELVLRLPTELEGLGETDLAFHLRGALSNIVRVNLGPAPEKSNADSARVELGRYLFYDRRMSVNGEASCGSCHRQELAFTDGKANAVGATGEIHPRSAMSLINVGGVRPLTWSDPGLQDLEEQALAPMFSTTPVELGLTGEGEDFLDVLRGDPVYLARFRDAFPDERELFTIANVSKALAAFERSIVSRRSPYDRYSLGERDAISDAAKRGELLFFSPAVGCGECHNGADFTDGSYHNTGLYDQYVAPNEGIVVHPYRAADAGKFKTPTLRNIELTAPYMHDGDILTLDGVLDHYAAGGRANPAGKDKKMTGFRLTPQNRKDLTAFLRSLTDAEVIHDPRFSDPWQAEAELAPAP